MKTNFVWLTVLLLIAACGGKRLEVKKGMDYSVDIPTDSDYTQDDLSSNTASPTANPTGTTTTVGVIVTTPPPEIPPCGLVEPGRTLIARNYVWSCNGKYVLTLQPDGNLELYEDGVRSLWKSGSAGGAIASMQADGNFVVYSSAGVALFHTYTYGNHGAKLYVQDDGNLVIYFNGKAIWHTGTYQ